MKAWRWQLEVLAVRHGVWLLPGLVLLLLAVAAWLVWLPEQEASMLKAQESLRRQRVQATPPEQAPALRLPRLPQPDQADASVRQLFALAQQHGLTIAQADYRRQDSGPVGRWQIQVPATGSYPQVRRFVRSAQAIAGLSLDEISLQRNQSGGAVEARMLFSIWYEAKGTP
ncbi:type II secretion system protein GspM [Massilia horti]|uniref:Uncharacterized protein n=1 Tax=Massilia horti TaxID=2562153 RepID=A0A4Y9T5Z7_9BURK|nr:type II secretion system protein GspM [Massilia horti]TFW36187.1 hypothetical protein E4O92_00335 [Massilia horti]